jgi:hypothetical protein
MGRQAGVGVAAAAASVAVGAAVAGWVCGLALHIRDGVGPGDLQVQQHSRDIVARQA